MMIGLDTNILIRYIAQDDEQQAKLATELIESLSDKDPGFITQVAIIELVWVIQKGYKAPKTEIIAILKQILYTKEFIIENAELISKALHVYTYSSADFADCLIERSAQYAGCIETVTFDNKAAQIPGMRLLESAS